MRKVKAPASLWVIAERKRLGWKPEELAERLNEAGHAVAVGTIRVWEAGRKPGTDALEALEALFGSAAPMDETTVVLSSAQLESMLERASERAVRRVLDELAATDRDA